MPPMPDAQRSDIDQILAGTAPNQAVGFQGPEFVTFDLTKIIQPVSGVIVGMPIA